MTKSAGKSDKTFKTTFVVTLVIAVSKLVGLIREMFFSSVFGQNWQTDAHKTAYNALSIFILLFSAGISSAFIPIYTKERVNLGESKANDYANKILNLYIVIGLVIGILGNIFAPQICSIIYRGDNNQTRELSNQLTRIMFTTLVFWAISGVFCALLSARNKFIPEQLMGFALSITTIYACVAVGTIESAAYAVAITPVLQVVILIPFLFGNFKYKPLFNFRDDKVKRTFYIALPALVSMAFDEITQITNNGIASTFPDGSMTSLGKSYQVITFAIGIFVVPLTTIMFTRLSNLAAKKDKKGIIGGIKQSSEFLAFVIFPVTAICIVMSPEIIATLFQRGKFTAQDTMVTSAIFQLYILGLFGFGLRNFLTRVFFSLQDTKTPLFVGIFTVIVNVGLSLLLSRFLEVRGLALATSVAGTLGAAIMFVLLRKKLGKMNIKKTIVQIIKIGICAVVCFALVLVAKSFVPISNSFIKLIVCAVIALIGYLIVAILLRLNAIKNLFLLRGK